MKKEEKRGKRRKKEKKEKKRGKKKENEKQTKEREKENDRLITHDRFVTNSVPVDYK